METTRIVLLRNPEEAPPPDHLVSPVQVISITCTAEVRLRLENHRHITPTGSSLYEAGFAVRKVGSVNGHEIVEVSGPRGRWFSLYGGVYGPRWSYYRLR